MSIIPIEDNNTHFDLVELRSTSDLIVATPHCKIHGAMNKVSVFKDGIKGYWRCNVADGLICRAGCIQETR